MWFQSLTGRGRRGRGATGLAVLYAIATVLVQAAHDHHGGDHEPPSVLAGCDDPGTHWAGHAHSPDLSTVFDACPACQQRAEHAPGPSPRPACVAIPSMPHVQAEAVVLAPGSISCFSCRGPPRV